MRYFIEIAYKGTHFHGWQIQPNAISVQEVIQKGLKKLLQKKIDVVAAGRTDAGVHARQMYAHFDCDIELDKSNFTYRLHSVLPESIHIKDIKKVLPDTHARFDALTRSYEYHICLSPDPFLTEVTWQIPPREYDIKKMNIAAAYLMKYIDFKAFSKSKTDVKTYNCKISNAQWVLNDDQFVFYITADRFLRNMVRAIVGTLLEVGKNKISINEFKEIIIKRERSKAGVSVPAKGLFLTSITYPKDIWEA